MYLLWYIWVYQSTLECNMWLGQSLLSCLRSIINAFDWSFSTWLRIELNYEKSRVRVHGLLSYMGVIYSKMRSKIYKCSFAGKLLNIWWDTIPVMILLLPSWIFLVKELGHAQLAIVFCNNQRYLKHWLLCQWKWFL